MAKAEAEKEVAEAPAAKPKSKKKLIIIIVVVLLLIGGGAGFFLMKGHGAEEADAEKQQEEKPKEFRQAKLDTFIVNLSQDKSFLKVTLLVEYDPDALERAARGGEGGGEGKGGGASGGEGKEGNALPEAMSEKMPVIRDTIIRILSSKKSEEVLTSDGKQALKEELIEGINEAMGFDEPVVVNVYFTEFIIQ